MPKTKPRIQNKSQPSFQVSFSATVIKLVTDFRKQNQIILTDHTYEAMIATRYIMIETLKVLLTHIDQKKNEQIRTRI